MARQVEFLFDFGSPTAYLAYTQLPKIARQCEAQILWRPILLGGVHNASGNVSPVTVPAKARWMVEDIERWAQRYRVPFKMNPHFPINTMALMRGAVAVQLNAPEDFMRYVDTIFKAMWVDARNLGEMEEVAKVLGEAKLDAESIFELAGEQRVKDLLKSNSDDAVARGAFGAPTFFVDDKIFFGQDRLEFVAEALEAQPL